jgi:hypothetical protein
VRGTGFPALLIQGLLFAAWTIGPPLYAGWSWNNYQPQPAELAVYQYEHKLLSDIWTAVAAVLGVLFGIKK